MEETNKKKRLSLFAKRNIIILIILTAVMCVVIMGGAFLKFEEDLNDLADAQEKYQKSIKVTSDGIKSEDSEEVSKKKIQETLNIQTAVVLKNQSRYNRIASIEATSAQKLSDQNYNLTNEILLAQQELETLEKILVATSTTTEGTVTSKAEKLAAEIDSLEDYIDDSPTQTKEQKLAYLMNAAIVTKYPYIESIAGDKTKLNGTIKFYRYLSSIEDETADSEQIQLTFIDEAGFNAKLEAYESSGNKDVFNYFTLDEDENVLIAYGSKTTKTITTTDNELTLDTINEISTEVYSKTEEGVYTAEIYTVSTKPIDYQSLAEPYALPFNLLATLLVQTRNYSMVKEMADLAYNSEIVIGIYDNKSITVNNDEYVYNKKIKYTENTELIFDNVSTDPQIDISSSRYSEVVKECFGKLDETRENAIHTSGIDVGALETATGNRTDGKVYEAYISEISSEGSVTGISSSAVEFNTTLNVRRVANSAPTVGIVLADVWAGKWTATYVKEEDHVGPDVSENDLEDEELVQVATNKFADALLAEDGAIGTNLTDHSKKLKEKAIEKIVEKTTFTVNARAMTAADIRSHGKECTECAEKLTAKYGVAWRFEEDTTLVTHIEDQTLLNDVTNQESLAVVKQHVEQKLQTEANTETQERKEEFIDDITEQITYNQWPTAYKGNNSIKQTTTYQKDTTTYQKDSITMDDEGEKFSKILSKAKYRKTKDALLVRESWFWDSIREYEETAKLENLLRYLFNISYNTEAFGTFTAEDIEGLFEIFEPQSMMTTSKMYGNSVEAKVWNALINAGYSKYAAAGAMGNIHAESGFDPAIIEYGNGIGFGLCQWSYGRRTQLEAYAQSKGVDPSDVDTQIEFLITELTPGAAGPAQGYANYQLLTYNGYNGEMWMNAETPEEAAVAFCWSFERPGIPNIATRQQKAVEYYEFFESAGNFEKDTSGDSKILGTFTSNITGRTFTIIRQMQIKYWDANGDGKVGDYNWDTGCNRAAQVSVCSGYWSNSMDELIIEVAQAGNCVAPGYKEAYDKCGLTYSYQSLTSEDTFDAEKIKEQVKNGGYVVLYVNGEWMGADGVSKYGRDWAGKAHWVSILGYRELDSSGEIFVSDSGNGNTGWVPLDEFDGITNSIVFVNEK